MVCRYDKLLNARAERGVVVATPTSVKALFLQALECCQILLPGPNQPSDGADREAVAQRLGNLVIGFWFIWNGILQRIACCVF